MPGTKKKAILIVDHGSRVGEANEMLEGVAALVARASPEHVVRFSHMELAEPTIEQGFDACVEAGAADVTVHPYMLVPGRHATLDIPRLIADAARKHPGVTFRVTDPLGEHELIARVVLERVGCAERSSP